MIFYLVRHGRSISNEKKYVTGTIFDKLSDTGVTQVVELEKVLTKANFCADYYYVSQWNRAKETASIINPNINWIEDKNIGETDAGDVKEVILKDFLQKYPNFYSDNSNYYPNGESHIDLNNRVTNWFNKVINEVNEEDKIMVVSHSGPISCILQYITSIEMDKFPFFLVENASLTIIEVTNKSISNAKIKQLSSLCDTNFISAFGMKDD